MLPGITGIIPAVVASGAESAFVGGPTNLGSGSSVSGSVSIGAADADRRVVAVVHWIEAGTHFSLSSATIGGIAATIHVQRGHTGGASGLGVAIISAKVPTGTSATVALTFSGSVSNVGAGIWRLTGFNTLVDSGSDQSTVTITSLSVAVSTTSPRVVIGGYQGSTNTRGSNVSWTNLTEVYDGNYGVFDGQHSAAWTSGDVSGSLTVDATQGAISDSGNDLVVTSWTT